MKKPYVCNKWPSLRIRNMQFVKGLYVAKSKDECRVIENADGYGIHIFPQDNEPEPVKPAADSSPEEEFALAAVAAALEEPAVNQGRRGTR